MDEDIQVEKQLERWLVEGWEIRLTQEALRAGAMRAQVAVELVGYGPGDGPGRGELTPSPYGVGETIAEAVLDLLERLRPHPAEE